MPDPQRDAAHNRWRPLGRSAGAPRFESRFVTIRPGTSLVDGADSWSGVLLELVSGTVRLCAPTGSSIELRAGATFWLDAGSSLTVRNGSDQPATLYAVRRRPGSDGNVGTPPTTCS